ncbi:DUF6792 domain-containing protein [Priestia megaterium]|uniref:DUF6792 domain-containing protein n=1 Tax=Priestia megaterium TaxID=1404 RepID=UPI0026CEB7E4|nr:DUF6792 domain-containing protein [Priestia megaterium]
MSIRGLSGREDEIKKIYKEVKGKNPPNFEIYTSKDMGIGKKSGFDGAAIHFYDKEKKVNQVYYFMRGTEPTKDFPDVVYDGLGIGAGSNDNQIEDAQEMYNKVEKHINKKQNKNLNVKIQHYGDGHSLGGNLIVTLGLITKDFTNIRGLNDAPVNIKQLKRVDKQFSNYITQIKGKTEDISTKELLKLANTYYEKQKATISHTWVKGEPMHAQSFPGSWYAGNKVTMLGDMDTEEMINIGEYPLKRLAKWNLFLKLDEVRYNSGVSNIIGGLSLVNAHVDDSVLLNIPSYKKFVYYCANAIKDKEANLNALKQYLHSEINEVFEAKKKKLKMKISREEASPQSFMEKADKDGATLAWFGQKRVAEKVTFDKTFDPLDDTVFTPVEEIISSIQEEVTYYQKFLEAFFQNFEKMMEADESVASDIKSMKEVVGGI